MKDETTVELVDVDGDKIPDKVLITIPIKKVVCGMSAAIVTFVAWIGL